MSYMFRIGGYTIALLILVLVLHVTAIRLHLYWSLWWFDAILHVLGGVVIGLTWVFFIRRFPQTIQKNSFIWFLVFAGFVGIGWEVFEYVKDLTHAKEGYWLDTVQDVIADYAGAIWAYITFKEKVYGRDN